ncbi:uncharacterized protein FOBCDRAFT_250161 [Fusarium oxysporum Fo47]|uniref:uncharacterized protein n=1 Tax=Fusarium oxysporum Fo47 TaxID=660027 RepID=UPI002869A31F|nr:uncharacterized protein FOBCDRAFT_250161 [Fusarium oxysporum Fo47]QKD53957.2 hypothetical protein FOBCDRAFT_250161 [Fusarium oxysporum Fo47]
MSWLANRTTTRTEDMAYCMLGIFDINMPLLYGEGKRAFFRLQEEIIRGSNDHTIFCWEWNDDVPDDWGSLLAPWPTVFEGSSGFEGLKMDELSVFSMTNAGLSIRLPTITTLGDAYKAASSWFIMLQAAPASTARNNPQAACIRVSGRSAGDLLYVSRFPYPPRPMAMSRTLLGNFNTKSLIVMNRLANGKVLTTSRRLSEIYSNKNTITFIPVFSPPNLQNGWRFESLHKEYDLNTILLLGAVPITINEQKFGVGGILATWYEKNESKLQILLGGRVKQGSVYPLVKLDSAYSEKTWYHWKQHVKAITSAKPECHFSKSLGITAVLRYSIDVIRGSENCYFLFLVKDESAHSSLSFLSAVGQCERGNDDDSSDAASDVAETGWICALETHPAPSFVSINDPNEYTLGRIGNHNVVIAVLSQGYGTSSAASVATHMTLSFLNIRIGLLVGISGGVPGIQHDIRLGDVIASTPGNGHNGVFAYDMGVALQGQEFEIRRVLNAPPFQLLAAMNGLRAQHKIQVHRLQQSIREILGRRPKLRTKFGRPDPDSDRLYFPHIVHPSGQSSHCAGHCGSDPSTLVLRPERMDAENGIVIHYGLIASGNTLCRDANLRDKFAQKGTKDWQGYAAMTAAAYAKDLLKHVTRSQVATKRETRACGTKCLTGHYSSLLMETVFVFMLFLLVEAIASNVV